MVYKRIFFSILSLLIFLFTVEVILRAAGFSYSPADIGFKITPEYKLFRLVGGYYETKEEKLDLFLYQAFPVKKAKNEIRIFLLGGSSVRGLNHMELRKMIQRWLLPDKKVRVINMGGKSYGSNRLLLHMQEISDYSPDLVILYCGHNEFEEEFMRQAFFKENLFSKINEKLMKSSRFYQFLSMFFNKAAKKIFSAYLGKETPFFPPGLHVRWGITFDKKGIYENYRKNIAEMVKIARENGFPLVISTVAYNRMIPPFKRPADDKYNSCLDLYKKGDFVAAKVCFDDALDADLQPHRAGKTTNNIIKEIAAEYKVPLADVDAAVVSAAKNGIPGKELFQDWCHLNPDGNRILRRVLFETVRDNKLLEK